MKDTAAEMGQHVGTALARIVAEELEADWDDVSVEYVDTDPKYGLFLTGEVGLSGPALINSVAPELPVEWRS